MKIEEIVESIYNNDISFYISKNSIIATTGYETVMYIGEPPYIRNLARKHTGLVGRIEMDFKSYDDVALITDIHVIKTYRGSGIAKALYNHALVVAKKMGKDGIASYEYMRNDASNSIWGKQSTEFDETRDLEILRDKMR